MAPTTRNRVASEAIRTAYSNIFGISLDSYLESRIHRVLTYNEINLPLDFIMLSEAEIPELRATKSDEDSTELKLTATETRRLIHLRAWAKAQPSPNLDMWFTVTNESFGQFLSDAPTAGTTTTTTTNPTSTDSLTTASLVEKFKSGIKRSISDYPKLTDDKFWRSFKQKFLSIAASHDIADVFNPTYVPDTDIAKELFKARQIFAWSVLVHCLQTSKCKTFVHKYDGTNDAQSVFKELVTSYETGTATDIYEDDLLSTIDNMILDSKWKKSLETFFTRWTLKVQEYETIKGRPFDDETKLLKLIKAVRHHTALYNVVTQSKITFASIVGALHGSSGEPPKLTFEYLYRLLIDTAIQLDNNNKSLKLQANKTNRGKGTTSSSNPPATSNDGTKKTPTTGTPSKPRPPYPIPPEVYAKMTPEEREKTLKEIRKKKFATRRVNATTTTPSTSDNDPKPAATSPTQDDPGDVLRRMMSQFAAKQTTQPSEITINGVTYVVKATTVKYSVNLQKTDVRGSLIDGGANGGLGGADVRVVSETYAKADVTGIADSEIGDLPICTVAGVIDTTTGPIVGIFNQYAYYGKGNTIHSVNQLLDFGIDVNDRPLKCTNGRQTIVTPEGYTIPLAIRNGLAYMDMHAPSDKEFDSLPHVIFTSDVVWDPSSLDHEWDDDLSDVTALVPASTLGTDADDDPTYDTYLLDTVREAYRDETRRDVTAKKSELRRCHVMLTSRRTDQPM